LQLPSAKKLLMEYPEEVDLFDVSGIPEDVPSCMGDEKDCDTSERPYC
jgi:hypothetical protein